MTADYKVPDTWAERVVNEVKANKARLDGCCRHDFVDDPADERAILKRQICTRCRGTVSFGSALWYKKGVEHAGS